VVYRFFGAVEELDFVDSGVGCAYGVGEVAFHAGYG